jgi:hypothetical protein
MDFATRAAMALPTRAHRRTRGEIREILQSA